MIVDDNYMSWVYDMELQLINNSTYFPSFSGLRIAWALLGQMVSPIMNSILSLNGIISMI